MTDTTDLPRETGSDKSTTTCAICGIDLPSTTSAYGSVSAGACPNCTGDAELEAEKAALAYVEEKGYPQGEPSENGWTKSQIEKWAGDNGIELEGSTKADYLQTIEDAGTPA